MKFFKSLILINTLSCLTITATNANESNQISSEDNNTKKTELNKFLIELQKKSNIAKRTVKIDEALISIYDFFKSSGATQPIPWQITNQDVNKTGFFVNNLVSCEYSESAYFIVKLIEKVINVLFKKDVAYNRLFFHLDIFKSLKEHLKSMILTLVGLLKYKNNYSQRNHEMLNILLSWYVYIVNSEYLERTRYGGSFSHIIYLPTINFQVEKYLKIFILNNCRDADGYNTFKTEVDGDLAKLNTKEEYKSSINEKLNTLSPLYYKNFLSDKYDVDNLSILNSEHTAFEPLRYALIDQTESRGIYFNWNNMKGNIYSTFDFLIAKNANGLKDILKFEKMTLQFIIQIIIGYVRKELRNILDDPDIDEIKLITGIQNNLISLINNYIQKFKNNGQSIYLIDNMSIIISDLWTLCNNNKSFNDKKTEIGKYISKLDVSKLYISTYATLAKFRQFMDKISNMVICAILHPSISNVYWDKLYFAPTKISEYVIDLKYLHKRYEPNIDAITCNKTSLVSGKLIEIGNKIPECEKEITSNNTDALSSCLNELNSQHTKLRTKIEDLVINVDGDFGIIYWKKLLLRIIYNIVHIQSFKIHEEKNSKIIQDLKTSHASVVEYFNVGFELTCKSQPEYKEGDDITIAMQVSTHSPTEYRMRSKRLDDIIVYHDFFKAINVLIGEILVNHIEPELTLYWDGSSMTLQNVYDMYRLYPRVQLQLNYDYFRFLVKWFIAVVYSGIIEIAKKIIESDTSDLSQEILLDVCFVKEIEWIFQVFQKLPLYISLPINFILGRFINVLKSYDGTNNEDLNKYINILKLELEKLDYVPPTTTTNRSFSINISELIETISNLIYIYEIHKETIENAATKIGIDLKDPTMMYHGFNLTDEWN